VPTATIYPGDTIGEGEIEDRAFSAAWLARQSVIDQRHDIVGKVARRTLLPGRPIPVNAVKEPPVVTRGAPVQLVVQQPGLTITAAAVPLQDGGIGDAIRVRNLDSGIILTGVVAADGTVRVGAF
jgi:flagella basal body P-ring formation protein FlgA